MSRKTPQFKSVFVFQRYFLIWNKERIPNDAYCRQCYWEVAAAHPDFKNFLRIYLIYLPYFKDSNLGKTVWIFTWRKNKLFVLFEIGIQCLVNWVISMLLSHQTHFNDFHFRIKKFHEQTCYW